jgi:hypothetical protein
VSIITSAQHLSALVTLGISGVSYPYRSLPTTSSPFYPSDMASSRSRCLLGVLRSCVVKRWKLTTVMDKVRSEHLLQLTILQSSHLAERPERTTGYFETAPMLVVERHGSRSVLLEITSLTVCAFRKSWMHPRRAIVALKNSDSLVILTSDVATRALRVLSRCPNLEGATEFSLRRHLIADADAHWRTNLVCKSVRRTTHLYETLSKLIHDLLR